MNRCKKEWLIGLLLGGLITSLLELSLERARKIALTKDPDPLADNQTESDLSPQNLKQQVCEQNRKCHQLALHNQGQRMIIAGQKRILSRTRKRLLQMLINP